MQDLIQDENRQEKVRELFDRAVAACGQDFRSDKLWDYFIKFEKQQKQFQRVTAIYDQLLQVPTQQLSQHFVKFKELINKNSPQDTLSLDEFLKLRAEYVSTKENGDTEMEEDAKDASMDDAPPGEERPPGEDSETSEEPSQGKDDTAAVTDVAPPGEDIKAKKELSDEEELEAIKELAIKVREEIFKKTEEELKKRSKYEEQIRRPYFHAKPLEKGQIKNWKEYLDFEIENGSKERTVLLFERCMIACALYEEMWLKYAKHMESVDEEVASEVYRRSCTIHLPKKPTLHLHWAAFEESKGNVDAARKILSDLEQSVPNLVTVMLERINLERRQKRYTRVTAMYKQHIENSVKPDHLTFFASKLACFLQKVVGDLDAAREVLENAIEKKGIPEVLYMKLIDLEYQRNPIDEEQAFKVFQQILEKDISLETKILFSKRKLEFTRDFSQDVRRLQSTAEDHSKLLKLHQNSLKKRKHSGEGDESDSKKPKATSEIKPEVLPPTPPANYSQPAPTASFQQPQYSQSFQPHQPHMDQSQTYNYQQSWSNYQNPYSGYQQHQQPHQQWGNYGTGYYPS